MKRQRTSDDIVPYVPFRRNGRRKYQFKLYKAPKRAQLTVYPFKRQVQVTIGVQQSTGWAGAGFDLCIAPSLVNSTFFINGTASFAPAMPNVAEFTGLFDQYRIKKIDVRIIFSHNSSGVGNAAIVLPVVHCYNDYNDTSSKSLTTVQEYPDVKTFQLGKEKEIRWSWTLRVRSDVLTNTGISSSSAMNIPSSWIDTSTNNIEHLGARVYLNNIGRTTAADLGTCLFLVDYYLEFKFVR